MIQLTFDVNVQQLKRTDKNKVVSDSINQYEAIFTFDEWWNGYIATAQFTKDGITKDCVLVDNKCTVPYEVLIGGGILHVNVFSTNGEGDRKTVEDVHILVEQSGYTSDGSHSQPPTPNIYEQILSSTKPPYIGENDNWYVYDIGQKDFIDSGVKAQGKNELQPDWSQNDSSQMDYVRNRPFYEEEVKHFYVDLPFSDSVIPGYIAYGRKIGLKLGEEYILSYLENGEVKSNYHYTADSLPESVLGIPNLIALIDGENPIVIDSVDLVNGQIVAGDNCAYARYPMGSDKKLWGNLEVNDGYETETIIHKIDGRFLPTEQRYNPNSENAQSGIAVEEAIFKQKNAANIVKIAEITVQEDVALVEISVDENNQSFKIQKPLIECYFQTTGETDISLHIRRESGDRISYISNISNKADMVKTPQRWKARILDGICFMWNETENNQGVTIHGYSSTVAFSGTQTTSGAINEIGLQFIKANVKAGSKIVLYGERMDIYD